MADYNKYKVTPSSYPLKSAKGRFAVKSEEYNAFVEQVQTDVTSINSSLDTKSDNNKIYTGTFSQTVTIEAENVNTISLSDSNIDSDDVVFVYISSFGGTRPTDGLPFIAEVTPGSGSLSVIVGNAHSANNTNSLSLEITYIIYKQ